jgi:anti-sigma B factor antagonist
MSAMYPITFHERSRLLLGRLEDDAHSARLLLTGELDIATAPALERLMRDLMRDPETAVVLDVSALTFCDLAGLRVLTATYGGTRISLHGAQPSLERMLELTGAERPVSVTAAPCS